MIWRCADDFFKVSLKFKMAATDQFYFFGWCKNSKKILGNFFLKFQHHIPSNMGMCKWFFKDFTEIKNGRQRSTPNFFVGAKTHYLTITFPTIWRCAADFFKVLMKFKMAATDQL